MHFPHVRLWSDNRFLQWATPEELIASEDRLTEQLREEGWITPGTPRSRPSGWVGTRCTSH